MHRKRNNNFVEREKVRLFNDDFGSGIQVDEGCDEQEDDSEGWQGDRERLVLKFDISVLKTDIRLINMEIPGQEILTKDKAQLRLNFTLQYSKVISEQKKHSFRNVFLFLSNGRSHLIEQIKSLSGQGFVFNVRKINHHVNIG